MPTLQTLFDDNEQTLKFAWVAGRSGGLRTLAGATSAEVQAADIVGHLNLIHSDRLHVLGAPEVRFMVRMDSGRRAHYAHDLIAGGALGLIVAEGLQLPDDMVTVAEQVGLAIFSSPLAAGLVIDRLRVYLNKKLAAHCTMHGVFMDVLGMGVTSPAPNPIRSKDTVRRCCPICSRCAASACSTSRPSSARPPCGGRCG